MAVVALITVLGPDRVGLVSAITGHLFEQGGNLRDVTFATLGLGAEFTAVCELPDRLAVEAVGDGLASLPELEGADIQVLPFAFDPNPGPLGQVTHRVEVSGGDQPGLIARLSDIFTQFGANIVRLEAQKLPDSVGGRYMTRFAVAIAPEQVDRCLAAVDNTAGALGLSSTVTPV